MAEVKKHHWLSRLTFGTAALILSGLLLLSYCSAVVNPAKSWVFTIFGLLFIPLFLLTVLFFVWSLFRRSRMSGLLLVMLLPSLLFIGRYWQGGKEEARAGEQHRRAQRQHRELTRRRHGLLSAIKIHICMISFRYYPYLPHRTQMRHMGRIHFTIYRGDFQHLFRIFLALKYIKC